MGTLILMFIAGGVVGWFVHLWVFKWAFESDPDRIINMLISVSEGYEDEDNPSNGVIVESHGPSWFAYSEQGKFLALGKSIAEAMDAVQDRFPQKLFHQVETVDKPLDA